MDLSADQISQESCEGILRVRIDPQHQQMHVSECVGTLVSSHVMEASSPVNSWCYGGTAGLHFFRMKNILHSRKSQKILWVKDKLSQEFSLICLETWSSKMLEGSNCQHTSATCHQEMETRMKTTEMRSAVLPSLLSINQCHPATKGTTSFSVPSNWQKTHYKNCPIFIVALLARAISLPGSTGKYWDGRVDQQPTFCPLVWKEENASAAAWWAVKICQ